MANVPQGAGGEMNQLLIDEPPLLVLKTLCCIVGLNEAIVLQQINYYQVKSNNIYDEKKWVYNSVANWKREHFPFWSEATIKRVLNSLESKGVLISANYNRDPRDQTKWYSIDYLALKKLRSEYMANAFGQIDQMESSNLTKCNDPDCTNASDHNDPMHCSNVTQPLPKITTKNTTDNKNTSCPVASQPDESSNENLFVSRHPDAVVFSAKKRQWGTADDLLCAQWIFKRVKELYENATESDESVDPPKEPNWALWANEVRLMRTIDCRTHRQICRLFDKVNKHPFWCKNILSPSSLRKQWDQLVLKFADIPHGEDSLPTQTHWNSAEGWENTL